MACKRVTVPVGVLLQGPDGLGDIPSVPELHLAVVPAAHEIVLLVGIEVKVPHQLAMGIFYTVDLAGGGEQCGTHITRQPRPRLPKWVPGCPLCSSLGPAGWARGVGSWKSLTAVRWL